MRSKLSSNKKNRNTNKCETEKNEQSSKKKTDIHIEMKKTKSIYKTPRK